MTEHGQQCQTRPEAPPTAQGPALPSHPLLRGAGEHVDDLFHGRMTVKLMGPSRGHPHPDQQELPGVGKTGTGEPLVGAPG